MKRRKFLKTASVLTTMIGNMTELKGLEKLVDDMPLSEKMPLLFIGHGSPMNAIEDNEFTQGMKQVAHTLSLPKAILCISAHWYIKGTKVTAMQQPKTIHDFHGFSQELYKQQYPASGHPELANETRELLLPTQVGKDLDWGLDHGSWSVLKHLYPNADVPVFQLSIDATKGAEYHFKLAQKLQSLRNKGVLIIGSGNIIHNLRLVDWPNFNKDNHGFDWAIEAREWVNKNIENRNFKSLYEYQKQGKAMQLAVPTPDHYLPLIYTLGLAGVNEEIKLFNDKLQAGSLSMTSLKIG
ncbi:4,5-DOPA-extradiol-dioxygenase [Labilibacter marinus]|uniref:4,5-DOPA-extradiol-dioxygenase n=1 Tax=Labilibacter marinus TaxID=1477105 RepID=UPI00117B82BA|nr:4,5-DOPA dioxygenase extradiol [Labilibacter marinus]